MKLKVDSLFERVIITMTKNEQILQMMMESIRFKVLLFGTTNSTFCMSKGLYWYLLKTR